MLAIVVILSLAICLTESQIVRPCTLNDLACVGRNLAHNSRCNPNVVGRVPAKYTVNQFPFDASYFNASYLDKNLVITNHNKCIVSEFFLNLSSNTAVLALDCPLLDFESNRTMIQHESLKEDAVFSFKIKGTYPLIRLTTNLHYVNGLNLCTSFTFADVVALPVFNINPNDRKTEKYLSKDLTLLNIYERELFFWRARFLARYFINSVICNYGCNF